MSKMFLTALTGFCIIALALGGDGGKLTFARGLAVDLCKVKGFWSSDKWNIKFIIEI